MNANTASNNAMIGVRYTPITNALNEAFHRPLRVEGQLHKEPAMQPVTDYRKLFR